MAKILTFSAFQPITAPSTFVLSHRNVPAYQNRPFSRARPRCLPSSARLLCMTTSLNQNERAISEAVRHANTVIVGGGPTGLLAAILMANRNIPVTVIEQDDELSRFDPMKAYALGISHHGLKALGQIPSLMQEIKESGVPYRRLRQVMVNSDGTLQELGRAMRVRGSGFRIFHSRVSLVEALHSYSENFPNITLLKQTRVTDVHCNDSGEMDLTLSSPEKTYNIRTKLLLACDGKSSIVSRTLRNTAISNGDILRTSLGLGDDSKPTVSTGKLVKSITIHEDFVAHKLSSEEDNANDTACTHRLLPEKANSKSNAFWITIFPMNPKMSNRCGGRIATTVQAADHVLWSIETVEEGYRLFDEVLPQLNARKFVAEDSMRKFVESKPLTLPSSTRLESLVVHVGKGTPSGGVVFLGDAAHSFPPDAGQGVNSALEDVKVFVDVLESFGSDGTIEEIIQKYELERMEDVKALLQCVRRMTGYVAEQLSRRQSVFRVLSSKLRSLLSKRYPKWFSPSLVDLISRDCSYSEVIRLYDETTVRMWALILLIVLAVIGVFALLLIF